MLRARIPVLVIIGVCSFSSCSSPPAHNANWYYYWEKDNVIPGLDRNGSPASRWDWDVQAKNAGIFGAAHGPSNGYVLTDYNVTNPVVAPIAVTHKTRTPPLTINIGANTTLPVECAAATMAHEKQHVLCYQQLQQSGQSDTDGDALADSQEGTAPYFFIIGDRDTYNLGAWVPDYAAYGDQEVVARQAEPPAVAIVNRGQDWSEGGAQWNR